MGSIRAAKKLQNRNMGRGRAGTPQECLGWVKRLQGRPRARQKWAWVTVMPQKKPQVAVEPQEMRGGCSTAGG